MVGYVYMRLKNISACGKRSKAYFLHAEYNIYICEQARAISAGGDAMWWVACCCITLYKISTQFPTLCL